MPLTLVDRQKIHFIAGVIEVTIFAIYIRKLNKLFQNRIIKFR